MKTPKRSKVGDELVNRGIDILNDTLNKQNDLLITAFENYCRIQKVEAIPIPIIKMYFKLVQGGIKEGLNEDI